jgi:inner membrane protein
VTYRTHNVFGLAMLLAVLRYLPQTSLGVITVISSLIANSIGSILPDVDQASNRLWSLVPGGNYVGKFLRNLFISHRSVSHSLLGIFVVYKLFDWLILNLFNLNFVNGKIIFISLMIGYGSHILIDGFTEEGVPLLWPLHWKMGFPPIKSWRIKTDHWFERWVVFPGIILYIGWTVYVNYGLLLKTF